MKQVILGFTISAVALLVGFEILLLSVPSSSIFVILGIVIFTCGVIGCTCVIGGAISIFPRRKEIKTKLKGIERVQEDLDRGFNMNCLIVEWNKWLAEKKYERTTDDWIWIPKEVEEAPFL